MMQQPASSLAYWKVLDTARLQVLSAPLQAVCSVLQQLTWQGPRSTASPNGVGGQYGDSPSEVNRTGPGANPAIDPPSLASQPTDAVVGQGYNTPSELNAPSRLDPATPAATPPTPAIAPQTYNPDDPFNKAGVPGAFDPANPGANPPAIPGEPTDAQAPAAAPSPVTAEPASDPKGAAPAAAEPGNAAINAATVGTAADQRSPAPGNRNFGFGGGAPGSAFNDPTGSLTDPDANQGGPGNDFGDRNQPGGFAGSEVGPIVLDLSGKGINVRN